MSDQEPGVQFGTWWRFSKYEIRDGSIQPTLDAELRPTKPWAAYERRQRGRTFQRAYTELANLGTRLRDCVDSDGQVVLDAEAERHLLRWCGRYGLLGLLPHRSSFAVIELIGRHRGWKYMQRHIDRWTWSMDWADLREAEGLGEPEWKEACVLVERSIGPPGIERLKDAWAPFFPREDPKDWGVLDAPPLPLSDAMNSGTDTVNP
jgi:hypothetical protein